MASGVLKDTGRRSSSLAIVAWMRSRVLRRVHFAGEIMNAWKWTGRENEEGRGKQSQNMQPILVILGKDSLLAPLHLCWSSLNFTGCDFIKLVLDGISSVNVSSLK